MLLVIDNYDSFTYNLVHYFLELSQDVTVRRNDKITIEEINLLSPQYIVISPGPGSPLDSNISLDVIESFNGRIPILGVCLGHQCIAHFFGAKVAHASNLMHGKTDMIYHNGSIIFEGLPNPFRATRYHSLAIQSGTLGDCFEITAWTADNEIMGFRHNSLALEGVQFHPESVMTEHGHWLLNNFLIHYCSYKR